MAEILNVIVPVFFLIACGYAAAKAGLIGREGAKGLNDFVLYFCVPPLLFRTMQSVDVSHSATGVWSAYYSAAANNDMWNSGPISLAGRSANDEIVHKIIQTNGTTLDTDVSTSASRPTITLKEVR